MSKSFGFLTILFVVLSIASAQNIQPENLEEDLLRSLTQLTAIQRQFEEVEDFQFGLKSNRGSLFWGEKLYVFISGDTDSIQKVNWSINGKRQNQFEDALFITTNDTKHLEEIVIEGEIFYSNKNQRLENRSLVFKTSPIIFDILIDPQSVVPSFYKGRQKLPFQKPFNVSTLVRVKKENTLYTEKDFNFRWYVNELVYPKSADIDKILELNYRGSGVGASSIPIIKNITPVSAPLRLRVEIINSEMFDTVIQRKRNIYPSETKILVYKNSPIKGIGEKTLGRTSVIPENKIKLTTIPLYFPKEDFLNNALEYTWTINNNRENTKATKNLDIEYTGESTILNLDLNVENKNKDRYLQYGERKLRLKF